MGRKQKYETQEDRDEGKRINAWISHHLKDFLLIYFKNCVPANINYDDQTKYLIQAEEEYKRHIERTSKKNAKVQNPPEFKILINRIKRIEISDLV